MPRKKEKYEVVAFLNSYSSQVRKNESLIYAWTTLDLCENFDILRSSNDLILWLKKNVKDYEKRAEIPVIVAYDACKTLYPIIFDLSKECNFDLLATNPINWYSLDIAFELGKIRIYDAKNLIYDLTYAYDFLGEKRYNFDFDEIKTTKSFLSLEEQQGMCFDLMTIRDFLTQLTEDYDFIDFNDFGSKIFTYPSISRQYAKNIAGQEHIFYKNGKSETVLKDFYKICAREKFKTYEEYAYAKSSFRGGLAFTNPFSVHRKIENVQKLDVCSCFHAFLTGKRYPVKFAKWDKEDLNFACDYIKNLKKEDILKNYNEPFNYYFNAKIKFKNLRLKRNLPFALLSAEKFQSKRGETFEIDKNLAKSERENRIREQGFFDNALNPEFGFSKLISADECVLFLTESEFWLICQFYNFEEFEAVDGYATISTMKPHAYIVLQSLHFFNYKEKLKELAKNDPLAGETLQLFKRIYNSIYGVQVQDNLHSNYIFNSKNCDFELDEKTLPNFENFNELNKDTFYTNIFNLGSRVGASSRLHLALAILILDEKYSQDIDILSGDTDSLYIKTSKDVTAEDLKEALTPLHQATTRAVYYSSRRVFNFFNLDYRKFLQKVGKFEIEKNNIPYHFEFWNKFRLSIFENNKVDLTCAGLPQPSNLFNLSDLIEKMLIDYEINDENLEDFINEILGYNTLLPYDLCYISIQDVPLYRTVFDKNVYDYQGHLCEIDKEHRTISYIKSALTLGDTDYISNKTTLKFLEKWCNIEPRIDSRIIRRNGVYSINEIRVL